MMVSTSYDIFSKVEKKVEKQKVFISRDKYKENLKYFKNQRRWHIASNCTSKKALTMRQYMALNEEKELY